ncbi:hypothetical protein, partial [Dickeya undicola]
MAGYTGSQRAFRREERIGINQAFDACGFSMLNLGAYLAGTHDEEKGATVLAVQSMTTHPGTEHSITINDAGGARFAVAN